MTSFLRRSTFLPLAALLAVTAACADVSTAPVAELDGPAFSRTATTGSYVVSQSSSGDTVTTVFVVGTTTDQLTRFAIGNSSRIDFPFSTGSICDPRTSSYGMGTWNDACRAATSPIRITAKTWTNSQGRLVADFEPALRFRPGLSQPVSITLRAFGAKQWRVDYCTRTGCINEARTDPSLSSTFDAAAGTITRIIKHFSGYTVTAD